MRRVQLFCCVLSLAALGSASSSCAFVLTINPGLKQLFMMVGVGTTSANNTTVNMVSVSVPAAKLGDGAPLAMTSDSTQAINPFAGYTVCSAPAQVYVGALYRQPDAKIGTASATLQVTTPSALTSGSDTLPFSQISWASTGGGTIPSGSFNGGTVFLANIARNSMVDNCFTYAYGNTAVVPAGTFNGRAVFTLAAP